MKYAISAFCLFAAACGQTLSPSAPSIAGAGGAQTQAKGGAPVEVTFTKWSTGVPAAFAGVSGGDVPGTFSATVLSREPFDNGTIVQLEAEYRVAGDDPAHSFVALIEGKTNIPTQQAVLNGTVISGWNAGAQVHVTFDIITASPNTSCVPLAPANRTCFQGVIRVMPGSAS